MTNKIDQIDSEEARSALENIQEMTQSGLRRAVPPLWFGTTIGLLAGVVCTLAASGVSRLYMAPVFVLMLLVVVFQTRKAGTIVRPPSKRILLVVLVVMLAVLMPLILLIRMHGETLGSWPALLLGVAIALAGFVFSVAERRIHFQKIHGKTWHEKPAV